MMSTLQDQNKSKNNNTANVMNKTHSNGNNVPSYVKYAKTGIVNWLDPYTKLKPSDLNKPSLDIVADNYPMITEFYNLQENTAQVYSQVPVEDPLFQPSPKVVLYENYAPFSLHECKLYFRNNDGISRRIKLIKPDSQFFSVSSPYSSNGEQLKQSKIAAGMEIYFVISFKPQEIRDYSTDIVCITEREKFIVPVRAIGMRPMVTFPDDISFGICPIKSTTRKALVIQNTGTIVAKFCMKSLHSEFLCPEEEQTVQAGSSLRLDLFFIPNSCEDSKGEYEIIFSTGIKCYIVANGTGKNIDVSLSTPSLVLESSYISLSSQKTLRINNLSDIPIKFSWKSYSSSEEEEMERDRLLSEIKQMEAIEMADLHARTHNGYYGAPDINDGDVVPFGARASEAVLVRKYRNLTRALEYDPMLFVDDIFDITPCQGEVWAHSELEVTVTFKPDTAAMFTCGVFLDVSGRKNRLPLNISGQGIGPHATLSFDVLDVGDIFINDEQKYTVSILNKGDIPAQWNLISSQTNFGRNFSFSPREGVINPGKSQVLNITFESNVLGEFSEYFRFFLQGNEDMLVCQIKGHVVGPTFHFDSTIIDFGNVSFDYLHSTKLRLVNTSKIAMVFNLRVPQDGQYLKKEFDVVPSEGTLQAGDSIDVEVEFIPSTVKVYDYSLAVDIYGVGDLLLSIPIIAECSVSSVRFSNRDIDYGDCFIRYPYEKEITLYNNSDIVHTKFEFLPQMPYSKTTSTYEIEPSSGVIEPNDSMPVKIRFVGMKLGKGKCPIMLTVAGSSEAPLQAVLSSNIIGPIVSVDATELKWGTIDCLKDYPMSLNITNSSAISASMKLFLKAAKSKFDLSFRDIILAANETCELLITANLDDSVVITDEVHIIVDEGDNIMIPLIAKGQGTTMHCEQDLKMIDLGVQLTNTVFEKQIMLENRGQRQQYLKFTNKTVVDENYKRASKAKKLGKDTSRLPKNLLPITGVFTVIPTEITLRPRTATTFTFRCSSKDVGHFSELFTLESKVGKEKSLKVVAETEVKCEIVNPLLDAAPSKLSFLYSWERGIQPDIQRQSIMLTNSTALTLSFLLKVDTPFNLNSWEYTLAPDQAAEVIVDFDPLYLNDMQSHIVKKQISISYRGHPQRDYINLVGEVVFPNLSFDTNHITFGAILNDTTKKILVKATNSSKVVATYQWILVDDVKHVAGKRGIAASSAVASQVFDILPTNSVLQPGDEQDIEFTLFGLANNKLSGAAVCVVEGGPEYRFNLIGEASTVSYALDRSIIDFGKVMINSSLIKDIGIINNGSVSFKYQILIPSKVAAYTFQVSTMSGSVSPGETLKVAITVYPSQPGYVAKPIVVQIAHFDPVNVMCYCECIFQAAVVSLPRQNKIGPYGEASGKIGELWDKFIATATNNIFHPSASLLPPSEEALPSPAKGSTGVPPEYIPPLPPVSDMDVVEATDVSVDRSNRPSTLQLEVEMQRMVYTYHLSKKIDDLDLVQQCVTTTMSAAGASAPVQSCDSLQKVISKSFDISSITAAQYLCDFNNVILGQTKKRTFKITNATLVGLMNFEFDYKLLSGTGFVVTPIKASKLVESDSIDCVVTFSPPVNKSKIGRKTLVLPIKMPGVPTVEVILSANVCVPDIDISSDYVDFEKVVIGQSKKVYVRFHNNTPVTAKWALKRGDDDGRIIITPQDGVLKSRRKTIISIEYIPTEARRSVAEFTLRIESNKKSKSLKVNGHGIGTPLLFEPSVVSLGPIIPYSIGDEKVVTMSNASDVDVEVFSLNYDDTYIREEEILSAIDDYDANGIYRVDVRLPGQSLNPKILASYDRIVASDAIRSIEATDDDATNAAAAATAAVIDNGGIDSNPVGSHSQLRTADVRNKAAPRDSDMHQDILVVGPPLSGVTSICRYLEKRLQLVSRSIDDILVEVAYTDSKMGSLTRRILNCQLPTELAATIEDATALKEAADKSKADADAAFKADKKNKGKETPVELFDTQEVTAYNAFLAEGSISVSNLIYIFQYRQTWSDAGYGMIYDSIVSTYADEATVMQALEVVSPKAIIAEINILGDSSVYASRMQKLYSDKTVELDNLTSSLDKLLVHTTKSTAAARTIKGKKGTRGSTSTAVNIEADITPVGTIDDIVVCIPEGDETWIDFHTGIVLELESHEVKSLDEEEQDTYMKQLKYQKKCQIQAATLCLEKVTRVWDKVSCTMRTEHLPLLTTEAVMTGDNATDSANEAATVTASVVDETAPAAASADVVANNFTSLDNIKERTLLYDEYLSKVKDILPHFKFHQEVAIDAVDGQASIPVEDAATEVVPDAAEAVAIDVKKKQDYGIFVITLDGDEDEQCTFNTVNALLPPPKVAPADKYALPDAEIYQVIKRPYPRHSHKTNPNFTIIPYIPEAVGDGVDEPIPAAAAISTDKPYRWVIPANSSVQFKVKFTSNKEGKNDGSLVFEVVGTHQTFALHTSAVCEIPHVNADSRSIFMKRVKHASTTGIPVAKKFIIADDTYSFGPLLLVKKPEWRLLPTDTPEHVSKHQMLRTNIDTIRITNDGKFKCTVDLGYEHDDADVKNVFLVEPSQLVLEEGESKDVTIMAFPNAVKEYTNRLMICVSNNPTPIMFGVACCGIEPKLEIIGPWEDALVVAEAAVAACVDKKLVKDLEAKVALLKDALSIEFDRVLVGKTIIKSFEVKNVSLLPIAWEIDAGDFKDSVTVNIYPPNGILQAGVTSTIEVSFASTDPLLVDGRFAFLYSDNEGGLRDARVQKNVLRVVAEAYSITTVSLQADGHGETDELDFGRLRVGDYAVQTFKIGNKGKYKIGFKLTTTKAYLSEILKIEPSEGTIEPGNALAEVKVTVCVRKNVLHLKRSKDLLVSILEPLTGEVAETHAIYLSCDAQYNQYRLQPSKGLVFGALRFDSEPKTKRVELRNEGNFDMAYIFCSSTAEQDEVDTLDQSSLSFYASKTAAGVREMIFGSGYMERISASATAAGGKGAPAKGKDAKGAAATATVNASTSNPLVYDPDNLTATSCPDDPLLVSAFKVTPRIGVISPGQSVGIDVTFDPSNCSIARERLRVCVSGLNPKDAVLNQYLKAFEITGESCVPAIAVSNFNSIFEEQDVVGSLSELSSNDSSDKSALVGRKAYAKSEGMFTFGPIMCGQLGGRGVVERIRIMNPTKIDVKVSFKVVPFGNSSDADSSKPATGKDAKATGKGPAAAVAATGDTSTNDVFSIQPEVWDIPAHESRFVNIYFNPLAIQEYKSTFLATVDLGGSVVKASNTHTTEGEGKLLKFDISGSGTLPCIVIDQPTDRATDGSLMLDFDTVLVSRSAKRNLVIRNDGILPATCLFQMTGSSEFTFPYSNASLVIEPKTKKDVCITYTPKHVNTSDDGKVDATVKIVVLNNQFDNYTLYFKAKAYQCDAIIKVVKEIDSTNSTSYDANGYPMNKDDDNDDDDTVNIPINITAGPDSSSSYVILKSKSRKVLKFEFKPSVETPNGIIKFTPSVGHLSPNGSREIMITATAAEAINIKTKLSCTLKQIEYQLVDGIDDHESQKIQALWGRWDDSMKICRLATDADLIAISTSDAAIKEYNDKVEAEKKKGAKGKPVPGPVPQPCTLQLGPLSDDGVSQMVYEITQEPTNVYIPDFAEQSISLNCNASADIVKYTCEGNGENIPFSATYMFQSRLHTFSFTNQSNIKLPLKWSFVDIKRGSTARANTTRQQSRVGTARITNNDDNVQLMCPFTIEPEECIVEPLSTKQFSLKFSPLDCDNYMYSLRGETLASTTATISDADDAAATTANTTGADEAIRMVIRGSSKRPICHFDMNETRDYLNRRQANLKNEHGIVAPIECSDLKVVEVESCGLLTRNTYRFQIVNPTADNYEFNFETLGDASPAWRCVHYSGMLYAGKRIEIVFEYLPEDINVAEAFFRFRIPSIGLSQLLLFSGKVNEPKVSLSLSRIDFHSVMLGGDDGQTYTLYINNQEHLPFNFSFDKSSLMSSDTGTKPILAFHPFSGSVAPFGRTPITITFHPNEETIYNFNVTCDIKRKPSKLSLNIKGEGYAVHPLIQIENSDSSSSSSSSNNNQDKYQVLKPLPGMNYVDFGSVQVYDTLAKNIILSNNGKFNFDYNWETEKMNTSMLTLTGGKMRGTMHKGEEMSYKLTFAPQYESSLSSSIMSLNIAGKYIYHIVPRGNGIQPALHFSFTQYDFGSCFITSAGGQTIVEEAVLQLTNRDSSNNISIDCSFQKTRALWLDCSPTVIEPGDTCSIPIRFAPRDVKDYTYVLPFVINGTTKIPVTITGNGIQAKVELADPSQRRVNFGVINVGEEVHKSVVLVNRSKRDLPIQLVENDAYGDNSLGDKYITFYPTNEVVIPPRKTITVKIVFGPKKRVGLFSDDILLRCAGVTNKFLNINGKAQGIDISLDTDSVPFGSVVEGSQITKKVVLENNGDIGVSYNWLDTHSNIFSITPASGKIGPLSQVSFFITFKPTAIDSDIRQSMLLAVPGLSPLSLSCTGVCIEQPTEQVQTLHFKSLVRKPEGQVVKVQNPTDKECDVSPSYTGGNWKVPSEIKLPAKGTADLNVMYVPLTMTTSDTLHQGKLFIALPDGSAKSYNLSGTAGPPECSGDVVIETPAKKSGSASIKLNNWLSETQRLKVTLELTEKPSPATFVIIANAVDIAPNGSKEIPVRFTSYAEGTTSGTITFTNPLTNEYCFYKFVGKTTMTDVVETISIEASVRQSSKYVLAIDNPLASQGVPVDMGSVAKPDEWWTCDSKFVRVKELASFTGNIEASYEIEYRPLVVTKKPSEHLLTIITKNLGSFKYKIICTATQATVQPICKFNVSLGMIQTETITIRSFNTAKCDYTCSLLKKSDTFSIPKNIVVDPVADWDGVDVKVTFTFEPMEIGEIKDVVTITSPEGGDYAIELVGTCTAPIPQGPYYFTRGETVSIPFRNCFTSSCNYTVSIDSIAFKVVGNASLSVNAKSQSSCSVQFDPQGDLLTTAGGVIAAKLFVKCSNKPEVPPWIMYLNGTIGDPNAPVVATKDTKKK